MKRLAPGLVAVLFVLAGCAADTVVRDTSATPQAQTGSNIPRKTPSSERVQSVDPESVQRNLPGVTSSPGRSGGM